MCDRILVLASSPGRISLELPVNLPQPRDRLDSAFRDLVDEIYSTLTARAVESIRAHKDVHGGLAQPLPAASVIQIEAMVDALSASGGQAALRALAARLHTRVGELMPTGEALHILEFGEISGGSIALTAAGRVFARGDREARRRLFAEHLIRFVPLAAHIERVLNERPNRSAPVKRFESELEDHLQPQDAEQTLHTAVAWCRYAEILAYDYRARTVTAVRT
jgi:NitT/TauT family transport system ATP-binding protein